MAEIVGLVASAITLAATAQGAAQLSEVVFKVVSTFKNAPKEMAVIARELSLFSGSLQTLADVINHFEALCKPQFFTSTKTIIHGYRQVEADLRKLIDTDTSEKLLKLRWTAARTAASRTKVTINRWRSVAETVVRANRQVVENAQHEDIEDAVQKHSHLDGKRTELDLWKEGSFDTATWLYHLVFSPSVHHPPFQATVSEESPERHGSVVSLRSAPDQDSKNTTSRMTRAMIVWNDHTEPHYVVDNLLFTWTTLSHDQISSSSAQYHNRNDWSDRALQLLDEAKEEVDQERISDSDEEITNKQDDEWNPPSASSFKKRTHRVIAPKWREPSASRPHVRFESSTKAPLTDEASARSSGRSAVSHDSMPTVYTVDSDDSMRTRRGGLSRGIGQNPSNKRNETDPFGFDFDAFKTPAEVISAPEARDYDGWGFGISKENKKKKAAVDEGDRPDIHVRRPQTPPPLVNEDAGLCGGMEDHDWGFGWDKTKKTQKGSATLLKESISKPTSEIILEPLKAEEADPWNFTVDSKKKKKKKRAEVEEGPSHPPPPPPPPSSPPEEKEDAERKKLGEEEAELKRMEEEEAEAKRLEEDEAERPRVKIKEAAAAKAAAFAGAEKYKSEPAWDDWGDAAVTSSKKKKKRKSDEASDRSQKKQPYVESISELESVHDIASSVIDSSDLEPPSEWYHGDSKDRTRFSHPLYGFRDHIRGRPRYHPDVSQNPSAYPSGPQPAIFPPMPHPQTPTFPAFPPFPPPPAQFSNDSRLSRIEDLLAVQQEELAQINSNQTLANEGTETRHLSTATGEYNKTIRELARSFSQHRKTQQRVEADNAAERRHMSATAEEKLTIIHELERLVTKQRDDQRNAEERWRLEKQSLVDQLAKAAETKELASKEVLAAQTAAMAIQESLEILQAETEIEKKLSIEKDIRAAEASLKADNENRERFQRYEQLLKAPKATNKKVESDAHRPVRQTLIRDNSRSVEINEYTAEPLGPSMSSTLSPSRFFQDDPRRCEEGMRCNEKPWLRRERHNSFKESSRSLQSSGISLAGLSNQSSVQETQQTIVFSARSNANSARMSQLQESLARSGVRAVFDGSQEPNNDEVVLYNSGSKQVVHSTVFWEAPVLALGSDLLLTMRESGWKPNYSRKSAGGRTYFLGDQPVHSYFFQDHYAPHFTPPTSATQHDAVLIDKALVEEYALMELGFKYRLTVTGEYELDGRLTFGDLETLIERSFLMKENNFRRLYRQLQCHGQPTTPTTPTAFDQRYASSIASTISRPSARSCASTVTGRSDGQRCDSSQTSQADDYESDSACGGDCAAVQAASVSWVDKTTNPFRARGQNGSAKLSNNPWAEQCI